MERVECRFAGPDGGDEWAWVEVLTAPPKRITRFDRTMPLCV